MAARLRLRFRTKIWIVLVGLVGAALATALVVAQDAMLRRAHAESRSEFDRTLAAFRELQALRAQFLADGIDLLSRTHPQLRTILSTASLAQADLGFGETTPHADALRDANLRLQSALPSLPLHDRQVVFVVASASGELLYSKADPERYGQDLRGLPLVQRLLAEGHAEGVWLDAEVPDARLAPVYPSPTLYLVRAEPVAYGDEIHGIVLAGEPVDRAFLASLRAISGVDLALVSADRVLATTLALADVDALAAGLARFAPARGGAASGQVVELSLGPERYLALRAAIAPGQDAGPADFVLLTSLDARLAGYRALRTTLALVGGAILLVALAVGFALARGITRPLAALRTAARRIGRGELDTRVAISTGDELEELGSAFNEMAAGLRERELIKRTLERYVSKSVAAELLREPGAAALAGTRRELTVLFIDLGGFTRLAEELTPEAVVAYLNEYFEAVCAAVLGEDGTVKEFQGDGVVAFWGAPIPQPDHALRACRAALAAAARLDALCARWAERGVDAPSYRMGVHTAELVAGEIGSAERGTYGVVGDGMNLASRLEGANKAFGTHVVVSGAVRERVAGAFVLRELERVRVVGRKRPETLFELLAATVDPAAARARELAARYEAALAAFRARDFAAAARLCDELTAQSPDDGPARALAARARAFSAAPPPPDWDAVLELESK